METEDNGGPLAAKVGKEEVNIEGKALQGKGK